METLSSTLTTGEQSGGQEHSVKDSPHPQTPSPSKPQQHSDSSKSSHGAHQQPRQSKRPLPERKRLRAQRQSIDSDTTPEHKQKESKTVSENSPVTSPGATPSKPESQEGTTKQKRDRKPQKPGKYVCTYCGRACAKPSVLQKHIRSHTGERPYPCPPCGFSFKTKSNLYKHRKSHTHRVKAGLSLGDARPSEEQITESEDETRHQPTASSVPSIKNLEANQEKQVSAMDNSYAVRKRLAMRLSRGRVETPKDSTDEKNPSLILGSRESTESGYFSRSESIEQDTNPNTSAKSYAEIILGKYGRLGHLQRMSQQNNQQSPSPEDNSVPFTVPKKQVIDHITKLITINEAVVDTSKIDSVKPRRFSLSRKNSDPQKNSPPKEPLLQVHKPAELLYRSSGSITMGVPCEKFQHNSSNVPLPERTSAPLLRSHSMPTGPTSTDTAPVGSNKFRLSQSFDEREPSVPRRYGMLRRQPAIDEYEGSHSFFNDCLTTVPDHKQSQPQPYECETCGTGCNDWDGYKKHRQTMCLVHRPRNEVVISQMECSQIITHSARPGTLALRKRRKAESFELEDPASPTSFSPCPSSEQSNNLGNEVPRRQTQTCSVIQHTSSFEKQDSIPDSQSTELTVDPKGVSDSDSLQQPPALSGKVISRKLVRQHSVQVPEILVTEDSHANHDNAPEIPSTSAKQLERSEEFHWPQRSSSLAQLPIEKLPPKKKRLRLAEAAQSSGESSFESISLPQSPGQDSCASYASSRSTSFEESNRLESEMSPSLRRSRAIHMLTVPGVHPHREMRRSASEQAPHDPQPQNVTISETRSKSFDYSCLSPERSALGWRERRKCLLIKHTAVRDPDEEELPSSSVIPSEEGSFSAKITPVYCSKPPSSPLQGETISEYSKSIEIVHQWKQQNDQLTHTSEQQFNKVGCDNLNSEVTLKACKDPLPSTTPNPPTHGLSGAARAHYLPVSTGLKLEIPPGPRQSLVVSQSHMHQSSVPQIISSLERVRPITSTAVVVRFQAHTLSPACAIYTTLSQCPSPRPLEAVDAAVSHTVNHPAVECLNYRSASPELPVWSEELRASGSGGSKRMLSPSNSIELSPESQQQQKRVKEDEACNLQELKPIPSSQSSEFLPVSQVGPSYTTLLSSTSNSWCYLNYIKPNPTALDEQKPSVYSTWSTSVYDPNPPGLSSKTAMSLLHCKQRLSPTIYTTSSMSAPTQEQHRPTSPEIHPKTACIDHSKEHQSVTIEDSNKPVEEKKMTEETQLAQIRSNEEYRSAECPVSHKESSVRAGSTQGSAQTTSHNTHSSAAVKSEVSDPHSKPLHQITSSQCNDADKSTQLETPIAKDRDTRCDEAKGPSNSPHRTPASARRALFARRRLQPSAPCTSPAGSPLRGAEKEASPSSPRGSEPALACSSPGCHVSSSSESHRCLLTRIAQSSADGEGSVGPHRSQANTPDLPDRTQSTMRLPPREQDAGPHPSRGRPSPNLLSHLPLHSQSSGRPPSLLIPIGGIHMIQARPQSFRPPSGTFCSLPSPPASPPAPHVPLTTTTTAPRAELSVSAEVTNKQTLG